MTRPGIPLAPSADRPRKAPRGGPRALPRRKERNPSGTRIVAAISAGLLAAVCLLFPVGTAPAAVGSGGGAQQIPSPTTGGPSDIVVSPVHIRPGQSNHGYAEYRFAVYNRSDTVTHRVRLTLPENAFGMYGLRVSRSAEVEPGSWVRLSLYQLPVAMHGHGVKVFVDGEEGESVNVMLADHNPGYGYPGVDERYTVLVSRSAREPVPDLEAANEIGATVARPVKDGWSPNWLAYTRYDGVIVTSTDLADMAGPVRSALERYVESGGTVLVLGPTDRLPDFCGLEGAAEAPPRRTGFGTCLTGEGWTKGGVASRFTAIIRGTFAGVGDPKEVVGAHRILPVVENLTIPVRGMLVLMLAFVVVIGPVNLLLLRRKRKRLLLFVTTPAVSLLTCSVLFGYALFSEGVHTRYRLVTLTVLNEARSRATSLGWLGYYSPLASRDPLQFSYQTELNPQLGGSGIEGLGVDWTEGQHLTGEWIRARMPLHFRVRKSERRRERLKLRRGPDGVAAVNGLGAPVLRLALADVDGRLFATEEIAPGAEAALAPRPGEPRGRLLRHVYGRNWVEGIRDVASRPTAYLKPGTYVAVLDGNPFVEQGRAGARPHKCQIGRAHI